MRPIQRNGYFYHVILRSAHSLSNDESAAFCNTLQNWQQKLGHKIHAFCFMQTHAHLIVQVSQFPLEQSLYPLSYRYSPTARFRTLLIRNKRYLMELIRYIHLNPVKAGIVTKPEEYTWSSHRAYLGQDTIAWLHCDVILQEFIRTGSDTIFRYERFINALAS